MWFFVIVFAFLMRLKRLFNQNEVASYIVKKSLEKTKQAGKSIVDEKRTITKRNVRKNTARKRVAIIRGGYAKKSCAYFWRKVG